LKGGPPCPSGGPHRLESLSHLKNFSGPSFMNLWLTRKL
jgi:hypothetical protein